MDPRKLREAVLQLCYVDDRDASIELVSKQLKMSKTMTLIALEKARSVMERKEELDALIEKALVGYEMERIADTERTILRLGMYEMLFDEDIPEKVALSEAVRLCRKFATVNSSKLINGILDAHIQKEPAA